MKIQNACSCSECEQKRGRSVKFDKKILDVEAGAPKNVNKYTHPFKKVNKNCYKKLKHRNILIIFNVLSCLNNIFDIITTKS